MKKAAKKQTLMTLASFTALKQRIKLYYVQSFSGVRCSQMGKKKTIILEDKIIAFSYGYNYAKLLIGKKPEKEKYLVVIGSDPRPTSRAIAKSQIRGILTAAEETNKKVVICYLGVITTPLFESAIRAFDADGGVMITASHNPLEHNGWKYTVANQEAGNSLLQGGSLLSAKEMGQVINNTKAFLEQIYNQKINILTLMKRKVRRIIKSSKAKFKQALTHYLEDLRTFMNDMQGIDLDICLISDANGGSAARVNLEVLKRLGFKNVISLNNKVGRPGHKILPEKQEKDENPSDPQKNGLIDVSKALKKHKAKAGIVYDFDADRGNLVLLKQDGTVAEISPQDVACLNVAIELIRNQDKKRMAVVGHCATSERTKEITEKLGAEFFNVEVGEINLVEKMAELEKQGYSVPIGVEGYNGGTVFEKSRCRDGLQTLLTASKVLSDPEIFISWLAKTNQLTPELETRIRARDFYLSEVVEALPRYESRQGKITCITLPAKEFKIALEKELKKRIRKIKGGYQITGLESFIYTEIWIEYSGETDFVAKSIDAPVGQGLRDKFIEGGWRIRLRNEQGNESLIWLRMSKTNPGSGQNAGKQGFSYRVLVDSKCEKEVEALTKLLETLCSEVNQGSPPNFLNL